MIYNNQGGKIGFSSSKKTKKKLFTPIKLSILILSDIKNYREKSLPNSSRKESNRQFQAKKFPAKTTFIVLFNIISEVDSNSDGKISFEEFCFKFQNINFSLNFGINNTIFQLKKYQIQQKQNYI